MNLLLQVHEIILSSSVITLGCFIKMLSELVDIIQGIYRMPGLIFFCIKQPNIKLRAIKMEATNRFPVVVINENTKIAFGIPWRDAFRIDNGSYD